MTNLSEQKIIVCCDFKGSKDDAVAHGARIAGIFGKELCLFHPLGQGKKEERQEVQTKLGEMIRNLKDHGSDLPISSLTLKGDLIDSVERLAEDYDGIMIILTTENLQEKLTALRQSPVPFLFIHGKSEEYFRYDRITLPVNDTKVVKNTALWATYFGRFNQADIEILVAEGKSGEQQKLIKTNLKAIKMLLSSLKLNIRLKRGGKGYDDLYTEAVHNSHTEQFNLLIIPGWQISKTDDLFCFPEVKFIKEAGKLPVLCINPNRDMYILCD